MKRFISILFILALFVAFLPTTAAAEGEPVRYTVVFNGSKVPKNAADMVADAGGELVMTLDEVGIGIAISNDINFVSSLKGKVLAVDTEKFHALPFTSSFEEDFSGPQPIDVYYDWYQWDIRRVKADLAWADGITGSHDTVVAIIDTGIDFTHPDLAPNKVYEWCMQLAGPCSPGTITFYHGTHVAGTVAAAFGGGNTIGVGPNLGLAAYQVFEDGGDGAWDSVIWMAMLDVANQGFDVINMSLGGYAVMPNGDSASWVAWNRVAQYVTLQGVTIVASSGNGNYDLNGPVAHIPSDLPSVISVGATGIRPEWQYPYPDSYDVRAFYSNYGASVTLSAPGGDLGPDDVAYPFPAVYYLVFSTYPGGSYAWAGGTSMAAPHVAGAAGLIKSVHPEYSPQQVAKVLKQTADSLGDRQLFGHGMLNIYEAVTK